MSTSPSLILSATLPGEAVADDHVGVAAVDVARLDVADEGERRRLEQLVRLARQLVALASLPRRSTAGRRAAPRCRTRRRAYTLPITPNCSRCCGRHSTLAPTSSSTAGRCRVGIVAASAGRSTPGSMPNAPCAAITVAPVCPALKSAAASPRATGLGRHPDRRAAACAAAPPTATPPSPTTSGASTMRTRSRSTSGVPGELGLERRRPADEQHAEIEVAGRRQRAVDDVARRVVAAHRVDCDADHRGSGSGSGLGSRAGPARPDPS